MRTIANSWKEVTEQGTLSLPDPNDKKASYVDYRQDESERTSNIIPRDTSSSG